MLAEVGFDGSFLTHEHTLKPCRSGEIWYPTILDRSSVGSERVDLYERAHREVERLLGAHQPSVAEETRRALREYVANLE